MRNFLSLLVVGLPLVVGCGPKGPPSGTVTGKLTIGGAAPTEKTRVTFINNSIGQGAGATVGADGAYTLDTPLPLAEYTAFVTKVLDGDQGPVSTAKEQLTTVPKEFRSEETSPLKYEVNEGANEINIEIPGVK